MALMSNGGKTQIAFLDTVVLRLIKMIFQWIWWWRRKRPGNRTFQLEKTGLIQLVLLGLVFWKSRRRKGSKNQTGKKLKKIVKSIKITRKIIKGNLGLSLFPMILYIYISLSSILIFSCWYFMSGKNAVFIVE